MVLRWHQGWNQVENATNISGAKEPNILRRCLCALRWAREVGHDHGTFAKETLKAKGSRA